MFLIDATSCDLKHYVTRLVRGLHTIVISNDAGPDAMGDPCAHMFRAVNLNSVFISLIGVLNVNYPLKSPA